MSPGSDGFASPLAVAAVFLVYGIVHAGLRLAFSGTLPFDDALAEETLQRSFALAYQARNPPLWEWLLLALKGLVGPGLLPHLMLRYALMVLIALALQAVVREATQDRRFAAVAAYSLPAFYWFGWHFHEFVTHTLLLILVCLLHLRLVLAWVTRPAMRVAVLLAIVTGVGLITKWNFSIYLALVAVTLASDRRTRSALCDRRLLLVPAAAAATVLPVAFGIRALGGDVVAVSRTTLIGDAPYAARVAEGFGDLAANLPLFLLPWGLLAAAALWRSSPVAVNLPHAVLRRLAAFGVAGLAAGVLAFGVREVGTRYIYPVGLPVVVAILAEIAARGRTRRFGRLVVRVVPVVIVIALAIRLVALASPGFTERNRNRNYEPYDRIAAQLRQAGYADAAFVTALHQESGNLIAALPEAIAASRTTVRLFRPNSYDPLRTCVLFWNAGYRTAGRPEPEEALPSDLAALAPDRPVQRFDVPWHETWLGSPRTGLYRLIDLGPGAPACRQTFGLVTDR